MKRAWLVLAALLVARDALADPTDTRAETLFSQAREAMEQRAWERAAALLRESQELDPAAGTLLNLAVCNVELGRTATAYRLFGEALFFAERQGDAEQADVARERREAMAAKLSTVRIESAEPADITLDDAPFGPQFLSREIPVDPGAHQVHVRFSSGRTWTTSFFVGQVPSHALVRVAPYFADTPPARATSSRWPAMRVAGAVTAGVSLVALGAGAFFMGRALDRRAESDDLCPGGRCTSRGVELNDDARTDGDVATALAITGLAGAVTGTVLYLVGRSSSPREARQHALAR
jgi:hypothetical protein